MPPRLDVDEDRLTDKQVIKVKVAESICSSVTDSPVAKSDNNDRSTNAAA